MPRLARAASGITTWYFGYTVTDAISILIDHETVKLDASGRSVKRYAEHTGTQNAAGQDAPATIWPGGCILAHNMRPSPFHSLVPADAMSQPRRLCVAGDSRPNGRRLTLVVMATAAFAAPLSGSRAIAAPAPHRPAVAVIGTEPKVFAEGVISTVDDETNLSFTPDGDTVYFTKRSMWGGVSVICVSASGGRTVADA